MLVEINELGAIQIMMYDDATSITRDTYIQYQLNVIDRVLQSSLSFIYTNNYLVYHIQLILFSYYYQKCRFYGEH